MNELCQMMKEASDKINVRSIDTSLENLKVQQEMLSGAVSEHREQVDTRLQDVMTDIFAQRQQLSQLHSAAAKEKERDQKVQDRRDLDLKLTSESLNQNSNVLKETMLNCMKSIDEKMKDVRSLLLHQSQVPKETEKWIEKLERVEKTNLLIVQKGFDNVNKKLDEASEARRQTLAAMRRQHQSDNEEIQLLEMDNMSVLMKESQVQTQRTIIMTGALLGVFIYGINKFL